jgi:hypothetical protein
LLQTLLHLLGAPSGAPSVLVAPILHFLLRGYFRFSYSPESYQFYIYISATIVLFGAEVNEQIYREFAEQRQNGD